jgi:hypothetical protein
MFGPTAFHEFGRDIVLPYLTKSYGYFRLVLYVHDNSSTQFIIRDFVDHFDLEICRFNSALYLEI